MGNSKSGRRSPNFIELIWRCNKCGKDKSIHDFCIDKTRPSGHSKPCKSCHTEDGRKYKKDNPLKVKQYFRNNHLAKTYGVSTDWYKLKIESQNNLCAICKRSESAYGNLCVDHDHNTGKVRDLLCNRCNSAIGFLDEDILRFEAAIEYLKKHLGNN
jgi:hypothetical protein